MDRRSLLMTGTAALLTAMPHAEAQIRRKPNFIVILCDDLGFGDIEPFGNRFLKTPNLVRMAREGTVLTDYYAPANICTPSRAGLLTGRYPIRTGLGWNVILPPETRGLPLSEVTIGAALKPDYATALVGKWHLGHVAPYWPPTGHGFDYFYGIPYSHDMSPLSLYEIRGETVQTVEAAVDLPRLQQHFAESAERFIDANKDRPFFLELALSAPHLPEHPNDAFKGKTQIGPYGDVVEEIDSIVGRILDKVKSHGLERDTLIVFTSDNGPWYEGSTNGLRDRKGSSAWDGASRVPFIAWQPGTVAPGVRSSAIAMGIDLLPTFCAMAKIAPPAGVKLDGKDMTRVLTKAGPSPHDSLLLFNDEDIAGIRTDRWKLVVETYYRGMAVPLEVRGYPQLYDLKLDPSESYNVAALHPDVLASLTAQWEAARRELEPLRTHPTAMTGRPPPKQD
jgi:arylsulfatase A-like enzyme